MRRSLCRLQLHAVFCEVSVLHARVQGCSSRTRGKTAGNRRSFVEASGGKDLAEQGLVAINIGGAGEGKTKETGTEGSGGREGEQGGPTGSEGSNGCRPQRSRHSTGPAASEEANELGGRGSSGHQPQVQNNKSAPLRAHQLSVDAFLSPACQAKTGALVLALVPRAAHRSATSIERGDQVWRKTIVVSPRHIPTAEPPGKQWHDIVCFRMPMVFFRMSMVFFRLFMFV